MDAYILYCRDVYLNPSSITVSEIVSASDLGVPASIEEWKERIEEEKLESRYYSRGVSI